MSPKVTIVVPVFNLNPLLRETIDCILSQSFTDFEVLIIDDGSDDGSLQLVQEYLAKDTRINLLNNKRKKGVSGNRNTGIDNARGEWIAFLDGDDLWHPDALFLRLQALNKYPNTRFISCDYACFVENIHNCEPSRATLNPIWNEYFGEALGNKQLVYLDKPLNIFLQTVLVHTNTVMVKTDLIRALKGFDESLPTAEDVLLWIRVSNRSSLVFVPQTLAFYRQRPGSLTHSNKSLFQHAPRAYRKLLDDPEFFDYRFELIRNIQVFIHQNSFFYRKQKQYWRAILSSIEGVVWQSKSWVAWKNLFASLLLQ
ncbi:glycosyltransferase family 2 protein [Crenothrix sp.]|uniref:glycosyltransferase family 2 protein n=1 Tax=Crenothrix sp. TaxID=3100433 RepID=UPI00374CA9B4